MDQLPTINHRSPAPSAGLTDLALDLSRKLGTAIGQQGDLQQFARPGARADEATIGLGVDQLTQFMPQVLERKPQPNRGREIFPITDGGIAQGVKVWKREVYEGQGRARYGWKGLSDDVQSGTMVFSIDQGALEDVPFDAAWNLQELEARAAAVAMGRAANLDIIGTKMMLAREAIYRRMGEGNIFGPTMDEAPIPDMFGLLTLPTIPRVDISGNFSSKTGAQMASAVLSLINTIMELNQNLFEQGSRYVLHTSVRIKNLLMQTTYSTTYPTTSVWRYIQENNKNIVDCQHEFFCTGVNGDTARDYLILLPEKGSIDGAAYTIEVGGIRSTPLEIRRIKYSTTLYATHGAFDTKYPRLLVIGECNY